MTTPRIALPANLNNEDDEGLNWALLGNAGDPTEIVEGAVVVAGTERFWAWVRIRRIDEDGQVHFEQLSGEEAAAVAPGKLTCWSGGRSSAGTWIRTVAAVPSAGKALDPPVSRKIFR